MKMCVIVMSCALQNLVQNFRFSKLYSKEIMISKQSSAVANSYASDIYT